MKTEIESVSINPTFVQVGNEKRPSGFQLHTEFEPIDTPYNTLDDMEGTTSDKIWKERGKVGVYSLLATTGSIWGLQQIVEGFAETNPSKFVSGVIIVAITDGFAALGLSNHFDNINRFKKERDRARREIRKTNQIEEQMT